MEHPTTTKITSGLQLASLASPMVIHKSRAVGPSWGGGPKIVSGVVIASDLRVPLTAW